MHPQPFKQSNLNLGAGDNPNTLDMPVALSYNPDMTEGKKIPFLISNWKLSPEEILKVKETGEIWLSTMGWPPPPISAMVENPFTVHGYTPAELT